MRKVIFECSDQTSLNMVMEIVNMMTKVNEAMGGEKTKKYHIDDGKDDIIIKLGVTDPDKKPENEVTG